MHVSPVCVYVFRRHWSAKLDADPELLTSLRWLAQDKKNALHQLVLLLTRRYTTHMASNHGGSFTLRHVLAHSVGCGATGRSGGAEGA